MDEVRTTPIRLNANAVEFNPAPPAVSLNATLSEGVGGGAEEKAGYPKKRKREKRAGGPTPEQVMEQILLWFLMALDRSVYLLRVRVKQC
jgi:hypothetical protein